MSNQDNEIVWFFEFGLEKGDGTHIPHEVPEELLNTIIKWAEGKGYQIGGGYRKPKESEI